MHLSPFTLMHHPYYHVLVVFSPLSRSLGIITQGDSLQNLSNGLDTISYRVPLGVCAGIGKRELSSLLSLSMSLLLMLSSHSNFLNVSIYLVS
jgi:hypothetical protein